MSKEIRKNIDNFKDFIIKESVDKSTDFETIDKVIRTYIKYVLKTDEKINEFVPNTHIVHCNHKSCSTVVTKF